MKQTQKRDWKKEFNMHLIEISENDKIKLCDLFEEFETIISKDEMDLGLTTNIEHEINTGTTAPIRQPLRRLTPAQRPIVEQKIAEMLAQGIIVRSASPWCSPVVLVAKKGPQDVQNPKDWRLCIDYRRVNDCTLDSSAYPLPRCEETLEYLNGSKWFTSLDLLSGYYQVPMSRDSAPKTAWGIPGSGLFEYRRLPFGLKGAPSTFQRLMEDTLRGLIFSDVVVYIDDLLIGASDIDHMILRLRKVLTRLKKANLKIKPEKCKLCLKKIKFLGHEVSEQGISTDPEKIKVVENWKTPETSGEVHSFLGLAAYYRRFIKGFATIAHPLYQLINVKPKDFKWEEKHQNAFQKLKSELIGENILAFPNYKEPIGTLVLDTDASLVAIGGCLSQYQEGILRPIAYGSKSLSKSQQNYGTTQRELYALVYFVEYWRHYLIGQKFICRVDHVALKWLKASKDSSKLLNRWLTILENAKVDLPTDILSRMQEHDFTVIHREGKQHSNADSLSRCPSADPVTVEQIRGITDFSPTTLDKIQNQDSELKILKDQVNSKTKPTIDQIRNKSYDTRILYSKWQDLVVENEILYKTKLINEKNEKFAVIPIKARNELITYYHCIKNCHLGTKKTINSLQNG